MLSFNFAVGIGATVITKFIFVWQAAGSADTTLSWTRPGLYEQLQINNINIKQCKYKRSVRVPVNSEQRQQPRKKIFMERGVSAPLFLMVAL